MIPSILWPARVLFPSSSDGKGVSFGVFSVHTIALLSCPRTELPE